jgi:hypothetical protein
MNRMLPSWRRTDLSMTPAWRIRVSDAIELARSIYDRYVATGAPPTMLTISPEHPWRWRKSNPRRPVLVRCVMPFATCRNGYPR